MVYDHKRTHIIRGDYITTPIHAIICAAGPEVCFTKAYVSAQSLSAGGVTDLLLTRVNTYTIRLEGRWKSNTRVY